MIGEAPIPDSIDKDTVWISWACPGCSHINLQSIDQVGFGMSIDTTIVNEDGKCYAWMQADCPVCGGRFERWLGDGQYNDEEGNHGTM